MAAGEETAAAAQSATADIDRRLNTLVSLVEQHTADLTTMTAAVNKAAAAADTAAATAASNSAICQELKTSSEKIRNTQDRMMNSILDLQNWQPSIDSSLRSMSARLSKIEGLPPAAPRSTLGPDGHHVDLTTQGTASRVNHTPEQALPNGAPFPSNAFFDVDSSPQRHARDHYQHQDKWEREYRAEFRMPKTSFPKFDGQQPKIWKEKCDKYFHMFHVPEEYKAQYATLHFVGSAALWLQTYEAQHEIGSWIQLCVAVCDKFGKDLYFTHMNEALEIRQTGDVASYYQEFELLRHQLLTHNHTLDDTFFVAKFLKGLKNEICAPIILHKPRTVDAAVSLALLQESELAASQKKHHRAYEPRQWHNNAGQGIMGVHPKEATQADIAVNHASKAVVAPNAHDNLATLKAQRRARGECFKCGGKFSPGHKCPQHVSLSVIEQLCEALHIEAESESNAEPHNSGSDTSEEILCLSSAATHGTTGKKTLRLQGYMGQRQVLILIDSGSSGNYLSASLLDKIGGEVTTTTPAAVTIADGTKLISDSMIKGLKWGVQDHKFETTVRVLKLGCYDLILGMEWLEEFSPMWVDWRIKKLRFQHAGKRITIRGIKDNTASSSTISAKHLHSLVAQAAVAQLIQLPVQSEHTIQETTPLVNQDVIDAEIYCYKPKHFGLMHGAPTAVPDLEQWLKEKDEMNELMQQNHLRAQQTITSQPDKQRTERSFNVADQVYLKLQPYVQTSIARRSNQKLSYKYFGPYIILKKVGQVAYKLQLPPGSQIHLVPHVSLLKKALPAAETAVPDIPL